MPLIRDMGVRWASDSNVGVIGRDHEGKALPFFFELHQPRWGTRRKLREVLASASSSDRIRSMVCLSSTREPNLRDLDRDYLSVLSTRGRPNGGQHIRGYDKRLYQLRLNMDAQWARRLMGRTFQWLRSGRLDATIEVCRRAVSEVFGSAGAAQCGTLIAGAHVLTSNEPPTIQRLRPWLQEHCKD